MSKKKDLEKIYRIIKLIKPVYYFKYFKAGALSLIDLMLFFLLFACVNGSSPETNTHLKIKDFGLYSVVPCPFF
jgi:hypothetical protein